MFSNVLSKENRQCQIENRFVMPAMGSNHGTDDGRVGQKIIDYVAREGWIRPYHYRIYMRRLARKSPPGQLLITSDDYIEGFKSLRMLFTKQRAKSFTNSAFRKTNQFIFHRNAACGTISNSMSCKQGNPQSTYN